MCLPPLVKPPGYHDVGFFVGSTYVYLGWGPNYSARKWYCFFTRGEWCVSAGPLYATVWWFFLRKAMR